MSIEINATNFPDAVFRQYVSDNYDTNHDGTLSNDEIASAVNLTLTGSGSPGFWLGESITGIEYLASLEKIRIKTNKVAGFDSTVFSNLIELDLSGSTSIVNLNVGNQTLKKLNCNGCSLLRSIPYWALYNCQVLEEIDFGGCANLEGEITYYGRRYLTKLNVTGCEKLTQIVVRRNGEAYSYSTGLTVLDLTGCHSIRNIDCSYNSISNIVFDSGVYNSFESINCTGNNLSSLNLPNAPNFRTIHLALNDINELSIENYPLLLQVINEGIVRTVSDFDYAGQEPYEFRQCVLPVKSGNTTYYESRIQTDLNTVLITGRNVIIVSNPVSVTARVGESVSFSVDANGLNLSYQWLSCSQSGNVWEQVSGANTNTLSVTATAALDGTQYVCRVSNTSSSVESSAATLSVVTAPTIISHPSSVTVVEGETTTFSVQAAGYDLTYQWQVSSNGTTWTDIKYATKASYEIVSSLFMSGNQYRCIITNSIGNAISNAATLSVTADTSLVVPVITMHPSSKTVAVGDQVAFSVTADGTGLNYQWQTKQNDKWYNISGATASTYTFIATNEQNNQQYRCQVSNSVGAVNSNSATLVVNTSADVITTPTIINHPRSLSVLLAQMVTFRIVAKGGSLSYQWQIKRGNTWYDISGATSSAYSVRASSDLNGIQYRCRVSNSAGTIYSSSATLTVRDSGPLPMYGYHSIIISGKNTYGEWEMYPTSRPHVAPPEVKTSYVDVPGADGGLDYTELLNNKPNYGYRKGSWEFLLIPQERWPVVYKSLCNYLHGREHTVVLEDDPNVMYTGRLSVNQWQSAAHNSLITIDYILDPDATNIQDESYNPDELDLDAAERILRKPENVDCVLALLNNQITIVPIDSIYDDGDSILY